MRIFRRTSKQHRIASEGRCKRARVVKRQPRRDHSASICRGARRQIRALNRCNASSAAGTACVSSSVEVSRPRYRIGLGEGPLIILACR
jgi:hypothetical protein